MSCRQATAALQPMHMLTCVGVGPPTWHDPLVFKRSCTVNNSRVFHLCRVVLYSSNLCQYIAWMMAGCLQRGRDEC